MQRRRNKLSSLSFHCTCGWTDGRKEGGRDNLNGLIRREREINRWMQFRQRARHLRQQWGEDGRVGRGGSDRREREAPSFPLAIAIANFSFPHTRCEEDEEGRRNVLTFYPCQPHSIVVRTSTPPPVNLPRPSTAALQHENREWGIGGIGGERRASISKNDDIFAF